MYEWDLGLKQKEHARNMLTHYHRRGHFGFLSVSSSRTNVAV